MKQVAVCLVVLVALQSLALVRAQNFTCGFNGLLSLDDGTDIRVTTTTTRGQEADGSEALSFDEPGLAPLAGDHDIILGNCEADDFDFTYTINMCVYPDPDNGTTTQQVLVQLPAGYVIGCIRILDTYENAEGEDLGGYPFVDAGGVGSDFVQIHFESQEAQGMKFEIDILTYSVETTTAEVTTGDTTPVDSTSVDTTPAETTPAETTLFSNID